MWTKRRDVCLRDAPLCAYAPTIAAPPHARAAMATEAATCTHTPHTPPPPSSSLPHRHDDDHNDDDDGDDDAMAITALAYTLIDSMDADDAAALLSWALVSRHPHTSEQAGQQQQQQQNGNDAAGTGVCGDAHAERWRRAANVTAALTQVEYFVAGTRGGDCVVLPLLPRHFYRALHAALHCRADDDDGDGDGDDGHDTALPSSSSMPQQGRLVLHRHARAVVGVDCLGTLVCSAARDAVVAVSVLHPRPAAVAVLPHPRPLTCVKLWDGAGYVARTQLPCDARPTTTTTTATTCSTATAAQGAWQASMATCESRAVYVITGDDAATVRLWRVDVVTRRRVLQHVFVCNHNNDCCRSGSVGSSLCSVDGVGAHSSLSPLARDDATTRRAVTRVTSGAVHCLALDGQTRLLAGCDGGVYVWALDRLTWRADDALVHASDEPRDGSSNSSSSCHADTHEGECGGMRVRRRVRVVAAEQHPLCWDEDAHAPLSALLACASHTPRSHKDDVEHDNDDNDDNNDDDKHIDSGAVCRTIAYRAQRLLCRHVWVREMPVVHALLACAHASTAQDVTTSVHAHHSPSPSPPTQQQQQTQRWWRKYGDGVAEGAAVAVVDDVALPRVSWQTPSSRLSAVRHTSTAWPDCECSGAGKRSRRATATTTTTAADDVVTASRDSAATTTRTTIAADVASCFLCAAQVRLTFDDEDSDGADGVHDAHQPPQRQEDEQQQQQQQQQHLMLSSPSSSSLSCDCWPRRRRHGRCRRTGRSRRAVYLPLACVEPVVYAQRRLRLPGERCLALLVLQHDGRLVASDASGTLTVWVWRGSSSSKGSNSRDGVYDDAAAYALQYVVSTATSLTRGVARCVLALRSPDVFITCAHDSGVVAEWHVYDRDAVAQQLPQPVSSRGDDDDDEDDDDTATSKRNDVGDGFMRCERSFTLTAAHTRVVSDAGDATAVLLTRAAGVACAVAFPPFAALFVVGAGESVIQTFTLAHVHSCAPPPTTHMYDGVKTIRLPRAVLAAACTGHHRPR